jgi:hypothetical protein
MSILYPVATSADDALHAPRGLAARERDACALAEGAVVFTTEAVGPPFATQAALAEAFPAAASQPWAVLRPVSQGMAAPGPVAPQNVDGRRWPKERAAPPPLWRLSVAYWRIAGAPPEPPDHARRLRRRPDAGHLNVEVLRALSRQPLRALKPQQPLDIGLFEVSPPEAPHILMPDE